MAKFSVVIPNHDPHLQCYREMALATEWGLEQLGHEVGAGDGFRPIYFGLPRGPIPADAILFNGEQVGTTSLWHHRRLHEIYKRHAVWDYSAANAARYSGYGLARPSVVRPGYTPLFAADWSEAPKIYDVVFVGSSNHRRDTLLEKITKKHSVLRVPFGVYGEERDRFLASARLCLNIHFYDSAIFEAVRCSYMTLHRLLVLTESSADAEERLWGITSASYANLADSVDLLLAMPSLFQERLQVQTEASRKVYLLDDLLEAVDALDHRPVTHVEVTAQQEWPELTLCMIVKDEAEIIERCLASVKPMLRRWSIVDTGSTDGTQEIIRRFMADVPGSLHERPWRNYDGSRNEAIDLARGECGAQGWLLLIDADEIYQHDNVAPLELADHFDCYLAWISRRGSSWGRVTFLRANKPWFFVLPRHEGLYCRQYAPTCINPLDSAHILSTYDGARAKTSEHERYSEDARVLAAWIAENPASPYLSRAQYYLAQSYRDASTGVVPLDRAMSELSIEHYLKRTKMGDFDQEVFAAYRWAVDGMIKCDYPWEKIQDTLLQAFNYRPIRAEPLFLIGEHYRILEQYALAEMFLRKAASLPLPQDSFPDLDRSVYIWRAKEELAVALTYLDGHAEAKALNREVLQLPDLEIHQRIRIEANLEMCLRFAPDPG
jgi:glycosyltransferase involved in cell wall biosynthesis